MERSQLIFEIHGFLVGSLVGVFTYASNEHGSISSSGGASLEKERLTLWFIILPEEGFLLKIVLLSSHIGFVAHHGVRLNDDSVSIELQVLVDFKDITDDDIVDVDAFFFTISFYFDISVILRLQEFLESLFSFIGVSYVDSSDDDDGHED